jgi:DNA-binding SARP family transcriptional activator/tetratricopeptide (TPR) repeat protein
VRFRLLGPMAVDDIAAGGAVPGGARLRVLLAALVLRANTPVSRETLVEAVWDGEPPSGAEVTLRAHILRLRRALGPEAGARIETRDPGYQIRLACSEADVLEFDALCRATGRALRAADWKEASAIGARALELWRGEPLLDVPSHLLRNEFTPRLEQLLVQVREDCIEADLQLGQHAQLVVQLRELTAVYPLRERFHAQLMLALAHGARRSEALEAYRHARRVLVDQLGIEPGPELRDLHERVLAGELEPGVALVGAATHSREAATPVAPRQLPTAAQHFIGRHVELDELTRLLDETDASGGTVVISAIDGMAGIGKTALAVHAAHRLAEKFPDGQLFIDLHGYTQGHPPRTPGDALAWLLQSLGVPPERIPTDDEQAAALYRHRLDGTATLIVLDNAATEAQVRPLLPGTGSCLALVTSRKRLKGLDDAHVISLDLLSPPDALALLRAVAGAGRVQPEDPLADELAGLCGYLPLALRIAASLLRHRPAWPLEHLAGQLRDQHRRVTALSDGERELAAVFNLSYASLKAPHRQLWRLLGLIAGPDLDVYAAAALAECDPVTITGLLEDLVDHNLLTAHAPGRYRLHDLLRVQARTLAEADPESEREVAMDRLLHYYAHTAQGASVPIAHYPRPAPDGPAPTHTPVLTEQDAARTWLRIELPNLEAAFAHARTHGLDGHAIALAAALAETLQADGPFTRTLEIHQSAAETAERLDHPTAHATALTDLGRARQVTGDSLGAVDALTRALEIYRALGNRLGEANALTDLGRARHLTGDYSGADDAHTRALEIYRTLGNRLGEANALTDLGRARQATGDSLGAVDALTRALEIYRALSHRNGEANALTYLGRLRYMTGDYPGADDAHTRALEIYCALSHRNGEANALTDLGRVRQATGDYPGAVDALTRALEIYRALGNRLGEAYALTDLGRVWYVTGDLLGASDAHTWALEIYRTLGNLYGEAYALTDLGRVRHLTGDLLGASDALTRALEIYRTLGDRSNEAWALNRYAATLAATGQRPRALALYRQALAMNRELDKPDDEAASLEGIAEHHLADDDPAQGTAHLHQALEIYQRLGMAPDTRRVQQRLDGLTARRHRPSAAPRHEDTPA